MDRITLRPIRSLESKRTNSTLLPPRPFGPPLLFQEGSCSFLLLLQFIHTFTDRAYSDADRDFDDPLGKALEFGTEDQAPPAFLDLRSPAQGTCGMDMAGKRENMDRLSGGMLGALDGDRNTGDLAR